MWLLRLLCSVIVCREWEWVLQEMKLCVYSRWIDIMSRKHLVDEVADVSIDGE